jgi:hypothetical protein
MADGMWTAGLVAAANRRGTAGILDGVGGDRAKGLNHVELTELSVCDGENEQEGAEDGGGGSDRLGWDAVIAKAHSRLQPCSSSSPQQQRQPGTTAAADMEESDFPPPASNGGNEPLAARGGAGPTGAQASDIGEQSKHHSHHSSLSEALLRPEAVEWELHAPAAASSSAAPAVAGLAAVPAPDDFSLHATRTAPAGAQ